MLLLGALLLWGCEEPFQPLGERDRHFSMYGTLQLGADTQWVRVMPIRASIFTEPEPIDATVTLEHLGTGRTVELRDSLVRYTAADSEVSTDRWAHNFWTTERIDPGASYRVSAVRSDGATSSAVVTMPPLPERIAVEIGQQNSGQVYRGDFLRVDGVTHLAIVHVRYLLDTCELDLPHIDLHQPNSRTSDDSGAPRVSVNWRTGRLVCGGRPDPWGWRDLRIVVSGSAWPFDADLEPGVYQQVDAASNVEGGVGYLGGIVTIQVPYELCTPAPAAASPGPYCELIYDSNTVYLQGTVREIRCGGPPTPPVTVTLTELGGEWSRPVRTDSMGRYRIGGLQSGKTYRLLATGSTVDPLEETLEFSAGERRVHDLEMRQVTVCPPA